MLLPSVVAVGTFAPSAAATPAVLDPSFGQGGTVITPTPVNIMNGRLLDLAQDRRGKLVAGGQTIFESFGLFRYQQDGSLDTSFGQDGFVEAPFSEFGGTGGLEVQPDEKIVSTGFSLGGAGRSLVARTNVDGTPDRSFGKGRGRVATNLGREGGTSLDLDLQRDGKIVVVGVAYRNSRHHAGIVLRYKRNGALDKSFGRKGKVRFDARGPSFTGLRDVVVLRTGKILVVGDYKGKFLLARLRPNGKLDRRFGGGDGRVITNVDRSCLCAFAESVAVQRNGRIVVQGNVYERSEYVALARFRRNGRLDRGFGRRGITRTKLGPRLEARDLALQGDGRIVVAGTSGQIATFTVVRYRPNGELDRSFGNGGFMPLFGTDSAGYAALRQRDGRIVVGGQVGFEEHQRFALARILPGS